MRRHDVIEAARLFHVRIGPWLRSAANTRFYRVIDEDALRARRRSDTVFIFGSGWSLNELTDDNWGNISRHDTFGFNWFVHERFVRCDFHLIRGIPDTDLDLAVWRRQIAEYGHLIRSNPCFTNTAFLVHGGFRAINGNRAVGYRILPESNPIFRWRTNVHADLPTESFKAGLTHGHSTLQEAINATYLLGWKNIVLAGVDLYDRRYFWLAQDETRTVDLRRGAHAADAHARATSGLIATLAAWRGSLCARGVELVVLNPKSLAAGVLPTWDLG